MSILPNKMIGKDLVVQEQYESDVEKNLFDGMDSVDRRDKLGSIMSRPLSKEGKRTIERIFKK